MTFRKKPIIFLIIILSIWLISIVIFTFSTIIWETQTYPTTINPLLQTIFWASAITASLACFLVGLHEIGVISTLKNIIKAHSNKKYQFFH
jgi:hypothetical protein